MAPRKNKKNKGDASKRTGENEVLDKKTIEDEKGGEAKESIPTPVTKKPCTWLKLDRLDPQIGNKSSLKSCYQGKESKSTTQVKDIKDNKRKRKEKGEERGNHNANSSEKHIDSRPEKKERGIVSDKKEETKKRDEESGKSLGGLIFMCNAKTKPDCFSYQLMGVPANRKELVMGIKPGLKLFLYDYDLKILYGVYEASSAGGMKLEPAAFGGGFPAQVRFTVHKDCLPLPESMFKKAIKDNYDERTRKFKTELTKNQVRNLIDMFRPTPWLHPNSKLMVQDVNPNIYPVPTATSLRDDPLMGQRYPNNYSLTGTGGKSILLHRDKQFSDYHAFPNAAPPPQDPLFLTEQEYRNNGLQQGRPLLPTTAGGDVSHNRDPVNLDQELKQILRNPTSTSVSPAVQQREINQPDPLYLNEKDYRIYGLRPHQQAQNAASPRATTADACDPYDEATTSLVNRYLTMPMPRTVPTESCPPVGRELYINDLNHTADIQSHPRRAIPYGERAPASYSLSDQSGLNQMPHSLWASREPSVFDQGYSLQRETDLTSAPVSNHYSFAGPSLSQHR